MSLRRVVDNVIAAASAARWGLKVNDAGAEIIGSPPIPASHDGSVVTVRFEAGRADIAEGLPRDAILRRRHRYYHEFLTLVAVLSPNLRGTVRLHLGDHHPASPLEGMRELVFNRRRGADTGFVIVPDVHFVKHRGYAWARRRLLAKRPSWERRRPIAYWRGASTGGNLGPADDHRDNARVRLCLTSRAHPDMLDARLGRIVDCHEDTRAKLIGEGIVGDFIPPHRQLEARYLVSIDGWAAEWDGLVWKLASGSVVLIVESAWEQWYLPHLEPFRHYVPVRADLVDLVERIAWCREHDAQCRDIADAAARFAERELTFPVAVRFCQRQLLGG